MIKIVDLNISCQLNQTNFNGHQLIVGSPKPFAPGQPARLQITLNETIFEVDAKSLGSKRQDENQFEVRFRLIGLKKVDREKWLQLESQN